MKKLLSMIVACMALVFSLQAQPPGGNMDEMRAKMKERIKPMLVSKTAITDAEADKVIDIYFQNQMETRKLRMDQASSEEDKAKKAKTAKISRNHPKRKTMASKLRRWIQGHPLETSQHADAPRKIQ